MTPEQWIQLAGILAGLVATIVTTLWGFRAVIGVFRSELAEGLKTKIDVSIYAAKTKELHDLRNADREELVALRTEVRVIREHFEVRK